MIGAALSLLIGAALGAASYFAALHSAFGVPVGAWMFAVSVFSGVGSAGFILTGLASFLEKVWD